ncbi:MAG: hypothetical protein HWQ23_05450 [Nostoc sp. JL33]|nr:hypothetical protein [Nostoc sp. JL33]
MSVNLSLNTRENPRFQPLAGNAADCGSAANSGGGSPHNRHFQPESGEKAISLSGLHIKLTPITSV